MTIKSYNGYVPYLFLASSLATWLRIRILLVISMIMIIINIGISASATQYTGAGFSGIDHTYAKWDSSVCDKSPTKYFTPFAFTFTYSNSTSGASVSSGVTPAFCPFPLSNTAFRLTILCVGFAVIGGLFFQSMMSYFARTILLSFSLMFFTCFVLDVNQTVIGFAACHENFSGTSLGDVIASKNVSITCESSTQTAIVMFDFFLSIELYLIFECWGMCANLYDEKVDRISVVTTKARSSKLGDAENPMHKNRAPVDDNDYTPYEKPTHSYTPYEKDDHNYNPYERRDNTDYTPYDASKPSKSAVQKPSQSYNPFVSKQQSAAPPKKPPSPSKRFGG